MTKNDSKKHTKAKMVTVRLREDVNKQLEAMVIVAKSSKTNVITELIKRGKFINHDTADIVKSMSCIHEENNIERFKIRRDVRDLKEILVNNKMKCTDDYIKRIDNLVEKIERQYDENIAREDKELNDNVNF